jgi:hypothetical protein
MANVIDADLLIDTLAQRVITVLPNALAPLSAFTRDFNSDVLERVSQSKNVQVPVVTGSTALAKNAATFETGDTNTSNVAVTVDHYTKPFHITSTQLNQKMKLEMFIDQNLNDLALGLMDVVMAPINIANFTTNNCIATQATIAAANLQSAWAGIAKCSRKSILLDAVAYSKLIPSALTAVDIRTAGAYGFDAFHLNTRWSASGLNCYGFAAGPEAIAIYSGIPEISGPVKNRLDSSSVIQVPGLGLSVQVNVWGSTTSRSTWASFDVMFGAAFGGQASSGFLFNSAAP